LNAYFIFGNYLFFGVIFGMISSIMPFISMYEGFKLNGGGITD